MAMTFDLLQRGLTVGPYTVGKRLGLGGMGEVFVAEDPSREAAEPIALKLLLPHLADDPAAVQMFINEARLVARMAHPNIVRILDIGASDGRYYLAMELVKGCALSTLIRGLAAARRLLPPELVLYVTHALCEGLHHAHEQRSEDGRPLQIVHRDVTPQNVLVSETGEIKLTDFGIAKAQNIASQTRPGQVRGKWEYLAPEQARGDDVDRRADLFSMAATVAHLATLTSPFGGVSQAASLLAVENKPFPDLRDERPDLDPRLIDCLSRAAQKAPTRRFAAARELCEALPLPPGGCAEALGALVKELCGDALARTNWAAAMEPSRRHWTEPTSLPVEGTGTHLISAPDERTGTSEVPTTSLPSQRRVGLRAQLFILGRYAFPAALLVLDVREPTQPTPTISAHVPAPPGRSNPKDFVQPSLVAREDPDNRPAVTARTNASTEVSTRNRRTVATPMRERERKTGLLTVDSVPWSEVFIDGKKIGETPIAGFAIQAGEVQVVLKSPDSKNRVTRTVTVRAGRETFVKENLQ
ncbi:MAG: serine/threonine-protein kinase [Myxococcaceae bacterium]